MSHNSSPVGWPWMSGVELAIADPIAPVNDNDKRPAVKDLIQEHRKLIYQVQTALASDPLYEVDKHDDLWMLRFLLSHKMKPKGAIKAAKSTLHFRKEHRLDGKDLRAFPPQDLSNVDNDALHRFVEGGVADDAILYAVPDRERGVIAFLSFAGFDRDRLVKKVSEEDWLRTFTYVSEWSFQWVDYITRTTGRLTKSIRIADAAGVALTEFSHEYLRRNGKVMGKMVDCYPQMLKTVYVCNAPGGIQIPWRILRPLLPKRLVEKIDFIDPLRRDKERKRLLKDIAEEHLPERFGGSYKTWPVQFPPPVKQ